MSTPTGRTGYPVVGNSDGPYGPAQIAELGQHFDDLIGRSVATLADLPADNGDVRELVFIRDVQIWYGWTGAAWVPAAGRMPFATAARSGTALNIATGSPVKLINAANLWTTEAVGFAPFDGKWTIPVTGWYEVTAQLTGNTAGDGSLQLFMNRNSDTNFSTGLLAGAAVRAGGASTTTSVSIRKLVKLTAGDVIRLWVFHNTGGSISFDSIPMSDWSIRWFGPA